MLASLQGSIIVSNLRMSLAVPSKPVFSVAQAYNKGGIEQSELRDPFFFFLCSLKNMKKLTGLKSSLSFSYPCLCLGPAVVYIFLGSA